jgi:hypothetical protein
LPLVDFQAESTITKTFEFDSKDVPVGKGFKVGLNYGSESIEVKYGDNGPKTGPEMVEFNILP